MEWSACTAFLRGGVWVLTSWSCDEGAPGYSILPLFLALRLLFPSPSKFSLCGSVKKYIYFGPVGTRAVVMSINRRKNSILSVWCWKIGGRASVVLDKSLGGMSDKLREGNWFQMRRNCSYCHVPVNVLSTQRLGAAGKALLRAAFWGQLLPWLHGRNKTVCWKLRYNCQQRLHYCVFLYQMWYTHL